MSLYSRLHPTPTAAAARLCAVCGEPEGTGPLGSGLHRYGPVASHDWTPVILPVGEVETLNRRGAMMPAWVRRNVRPELPIRATKDLTRG